MDDASVHALCDAIIGQAATDYRKLSKGKKVQGESIGSVTAFFHSDWAQLLCGKVEPEVILEKLQRECL